MYRVWLSDAWNHHMKSVYTDQPWYHGAAVLAKVILEEAQEVRSLLS